MLKENQMQLKYHIKYTFLLEITNYFKIKIEYIHKYLTNNFILVSYDYISYNSNSFFSIHTLSEIVMKYTIGDSDCLIHIYEVLKKKLSSKE